MSQRISDQIIGKMVQHSVATIKFCQNAKLPSPIQNQIIKSVTSIGANFSEAQNASSKRDFINKIYIAKKEASETKYWLSVVEGLLGSSDELQELYTKTQAQVRMLQKIINTSRSSNRKSENDNLLRHEI